MLAWLRKVLGVFPNAGLGCIAFSEDTIGSHHAVDEFGAKSIARHRAARLLRDRKMASEEGANWKLDNLLSASYAQEHRAGQQEQ